MVQSAHPCHSYHTVFPCCTFAPRPLRALPKLSRLLPGPTYLIHQLKNKPYLRYMGTWGGNRWQGTERQMCGGRRETETRVCKLELEQLQNDMNRLGSFSPSPSLSPSFSPPLSVFFLIPRTHQKRWSSVLMASFALPYASLMTARNTFARMK